VPGQDTPAANAAPNKALRDRREVVRLIHAAEVGRAAGRGDTAEAEGVPVSSLYHLLARKAAIDAPEAEKAFFMSPEGLALLHRIHTGLHLVFIQAAGGGVDRACEFLALSRLDRYIAASHGTQDSFADDMERLLGDYADAQGARLGPGMRPKTIVVCEDETFHPHGMCLVAIDAESGMILLEVYSERRDGDTWTTLLAEALADLPVRVVQVVGDEAKGLIAHARDGLGCHFGPDLFHAQHDLSKATSRPLAQRLERPRQALTEAEARTQVWRAHKANYQQGPRPPGRPMDFDRRIAEAETAEQTARADYETVVADQAGVRAAIRAIGDAYHPFDLATGALHSAETVRSLIASAFATINEVADRAQLTDRCRRRIDKAHRVMPKLVATVAFFHGQLERALAELDLTPAILDLVRTQLAPGLYLERAARTARTVAERAAIMAVSQSMLAQARAPSSPFMTLDEPARQRIEAVVLAHLALFVRSSACVEGRNGHLARYHHGLHRLSKRRLKALTTIANYYARRADGTTAAERFFGHTPDDLFDWLLARLDVPAQPRSVRFKQAA
jgi:hypothetical protein